MHIKEQAVKLPSFIHSFSQSVSRSVIQSSSHPVIQSFSYELMN